MGSPHRLTVLLAFGLAALMIAGAGGAYAVGHMDRRAAQGALSPSDVSPSTDPAPRSGPTAAVTTARTDGGRPAPSASAGVAVPGATTTGPGAEPVAVSLSPSAEASPYAQDVADLIARYFTSINRHDYDAWLATVSTAQAKRDRDDWTRDYSTTRDSNVYISDITAGKPMTVRMQFTSHQAIEFAPPQLPAECVRWDVTYRVMDEGVGLRVGTSAKQPALAPC